MIDYFELLLTFLKRLLDKHLKQDIPSYPLEESHTAYTDAWRYKDCRQKRVTMCLPYVLPEANPVIFSPLAGLFI